MKKILITGGSGYLGSVLTPLLKKQYKRVAIVDLNQPHDGTVEWFKFDITNEINMCELIRDFDAVVHLAGIVGDQNCEKEPNKAVLVNYLATKKIIHICKTLNKKLIFASTCSIYGASQGLINENAKQNPISLYGLTKRAADEEVVKSDAISLRMGTLFGYSAKMRYDLVINDFVRKAYADKKIFVYGGEQMRPFLNIQNAATSFILALEKDVVGAFNIADFNSSILKMAQKIAKRLNAHIEVFKEIQDKRSYAVTTQKAESLLSFKPKNNLSKTINDICQYL